jgi:2-succinyl-5-enolpyruvyl-6-hydroxy-3-cyclohexene-1-carboxylate synthase
VLNNDGGGIFSFLEQAGYPEHFERVLGTPQGVDFEAVAGVTGCGYERSTTAGMLRVSVVTRLKLGGIHLIEVPSDRADNVAVHEAMYAAVDNALNHLRSGEPRDNHGDEKGG